ncbi:MAG: sulfite exporter TauE/SafE family protein [Rhodospirillaceae bacterium]|nr:sulfite exporter TauE/SafE family protein [Rhodospirillaceae bacterium]
MMQPFPELFGISVFAGLALWEVVLLLSIYSIAFFIKGAIGVGNVSMMVLFGAMILEPHHAVVLAAMTNFVVQMQFIPEANRDGNYSVIRTAIWPYLLGVFVGITLFDYLSATWLTIILGVSVGALVGLDMFGVMRHLFDRLNLKSAKSLFPYTSISGLIVGVTGAGGLLMLAFYVKQVLKVPRSIRGTMLLISVIVSVARVSGLSIAGFVDLKILTEVLICLPIGFVGGQLGQLFFKQLSDKNYHQILSGIMMFAAIILAVKGISQLI